jgi:DNA-directed RNA polymerase beta subunit
VTSWLLFLLIVAGALLLRWHGDSWSRILTKLDLIAATKYLLRLKKGEGSLDDIDHLGSRHRLAHIHKILENGTGADRQLAVYEKEKNLVSVVDYIRTQYLAGL